MEHMVQKFPERADAGRLLGEILTQFAIGHPIVHALPRGGIPVAIEADWPDAARNARRVANAKQYSRIMHYVSRLTWNLRDQHMFQTLRYIFANTGPDSHETLCHNVDLKRDLWDSQKERSGTFHDLQSKPRLQRFISVIYRPETERARHYSPAILPQLHDVFVWFEKTQAHTPLPTLTNTTKDEP
jgi:erythromycin esterase-like protein